MRKQLTIALAVVAIALPGVAHAEMKVGYVDMQKVIDSVPQAEAARNRIEKEFAPRDRELLAQQKEIRAVEDKLVKNAAVMSAAERQKGEAQIRTMRRELRRMQDEFREDLNLRRSQELTKLRDKVSTSISNLGKSDKYDLIVIDGVIYAGPKVDITQKVIQRLDSEFKKTGG